MNDAEATCGLQFCVVLCSGESSPTEQADAALEQLGLPGRPPVMVVVRRTDGLIDVELGPVPSSRLSSSDAREVLDVCAPIDGEDLDQRVAAVVLTLADRAGPGLPDPDAPLLPDVIEV